MFNMSFSEMMVIGVIALIVIGPERLPKVARTVGHLLGRAQRYVNEVKTDIQKEMDLKDIGDIKHQMEDAARSVQSSLTASAEEFKSAVDAPAQALKGDLEEARQALNVGSPTEPAGAPDAAAPPVAAPAAAPAPALPVADTPSASQQPGPVAAAEPAAPAQPAAPAAPATAGSSGESAATSPTSDRAPSPAAAAPAPTSTESSH
ncbi:Sec-independent protein translocase protein TatB [Castellaniella sp. UC4442_H9]